MKSTDDLKKDTNDYLKLNGGVTEYDMSINDISRNMIFAMKAEKGVCFLGKVNLYGEERKEEYKLTEYTGQKIYNFEYSFCLPCYDEELEKMIDNRDKAVYTGAITDSVLVSAIIDRVEKIGGINLFWA